MCDTIAAISTPPGEGGIGIVRISGENSPLILTKLFRPGKGGGAVEFAAADRHMYHGRVIDPETGRVADEVLAVLMRAPRSYTGEDVAELHCHGGAVPLRRVLEAVLKCGARPAEPGAFTKRAFLNGRLDLTQAEAVMDMIRARTDGAFEAAVAQGEGALSKRARALAGEMAALLAETAAALDYPEDDTPPVTCETYIKRLSAIGDELEKLNDSARVGRIVRDGLDVVIAGKPNVGKSSLMNALLAEARVIVTRDPGTTRDVVSEETDVAGLRVRLSDTAGIRTSEDEAERLGVQRSEAALAAADLILFVTDGSAPPDQSDRDAAARVGDRPVLLVFNKSDLTPNRDTEAFLRDVRRGRLSFPLRPRAVLSVSAKTGEGLDTLRTEIARTVFGTADAAPARGENPLVTNARHAHLTRTALAAVRASSETAARTGALDLAEAELRAAWEALGELTGEAVSETVTDLIFSRFCVGK